MKTLWIVASLLMAASLAAQPLGTSAPGALRSEVRGNRAWQLDAPIANVSRLSPSSRSSSLATLQCTGS